MTIIRPAIAVLALAAPVAPVHVHAQTPSAAAQTPQQQQPAQDAAEPGFEEQVVVTASRSEQQLVNAPAAVSVVTNAAIQNSPATNIGDLLRTVPGLNVAQVSTREVNLTSRGATSTLSTAQLALVDGRSIYLDFFGLVMWDLIPANPSEIRQIEVIRGPASAVWGANAMTGVVNVITRTPRELAAAGGTSLTIGAGGFSRQRENAGSLFYVNGTHARAIDDGWAFKLSAGYLTQDPLSRPTGTIPNVFNTPYPPYVNAGTSQPKFDARVDRELAGGATLTIAGGVAGTEGIIHTGIGPFDVEGDSSLSYLTARYQRGGRRIAAFTNVLDGNASNLLARDLTGRPLPLGFNTKTFDVEAGDVRAVGARHLLSFGANYRRNAFDISIAPNGDDRHEGGGYLQDEIFLDEHVRWVVGGRLDGFSSVDGAVFSPRTSLLLKPSAPHTFRVSFNRAFRAPSFVNNHLETTTLNEVNLSAVSTALSRFVFPVAAAGNPDLKQETMTAYEVGYAGIVGGRATVSAAVYWNTTEDGIFFTPVAAYEAASPPPGWPLPPAVLTLLAVRVPPVMLPSRFTYLNLGTVKDKGVELGVEATVSPFVNVFANYSYQWKPVTDGFPDTETNWPAANRANVGFNASYGRVFGNLALSFADDAYWQDVLDARFAGMTEGYTLVNGGIGIRWAGGRVVTSLKATNLANDVIQQHIFGDITKRQIVAEVRFTP